MSDYGSDFLLNDGDIIFTEDGDAAIVSGPRCIAQDIDSEIKLLYGSLFYDPEAGSSIPLMLNDVVIDDDALVNELERIAIDDPRIDPHSVKAEKTDSRTYRITFTPLGNVDPLTLDFNVGGTL